jgi:hypothetical protein
MEDCRASAQISFDVPNPDAAQAGLKALTNGLKTAKKHYKCPKHACHPAGCSPFLNAMNKKATKVGCALVACKGSLISILYYYVSSCLRISFSDQRAPNQDN